MKFWPGMNKGLFSLNYWEMLMKGNHCQDQCFKPMQRLQTKVGNLNVYLLQGSAKYLWLKKGRIQFNSEKYSTFQNAITLAKVWTRSSNKWLQANAAVVVWSQSGSTHSSESINAELHNSPQILKPTTTIHQYISIQEKIPKSCEREPQTSFSAR